MTSAETVSIDENADSFAGPLLNNHNNEGLANSKHNKINLVSFKKE